MGIKQEVITMVAGTAMALKHVADNLKREVAGLVDDLFGSAIDSSVHDGQNGNKGGNAEAKAASLLEDLKAVTLSCVEGRRAFSDTVGCESVEATEKLVCVLKKEVDFLKVRLSRELDERKTLGGQMTKLEQERRALEDQSRRIEADINEASESNARLEAAFGKTKRLVTNLRDSIDFANLVRKERVPEAGEPRKTEEPAATTKAAEVAEPTSNPASPVRPFQPLTKNQKKKLKKKQREAEKKARLAEQTAAAPPAVLEEGAAIEGGPRVVEDAKAVEAEAAGESPEASTGESQQQRDVAPEPIPSSSPQVPAEEDSPAFGSSDDPAAAEPEMPAAPQASESPDVSKAAGGSVDGFGASFGDDDPFGAGPAAAEPEMPAAPQASESPDVSKAAGSSVDGFGASFGDDDPFGAGPAAAEPMANPVEGGTMSSTAGFDADFGASDPFGDDPFSGTATSDQEPRTTQADPAVDAGFGPEDPFGLPGAAAEPKEQPAQQFEDAFASEDLFGGAPTGQVSQGGQAQQWQDMDLFEPIEIGTATAAEPMAAAGATIAVAATPDPSGFEASSWIDFGTSADQAAPAQRVEAAPSHHTGFDSSSDLLGWEQPPAAQEASGADGGQQGSAFVAGPEDSSSSWAQFDSTPQFWNDLPAPSAKPEGGEGQAVEPVDFFGGQAEPQPKPQRQEVPAEEWGEDPFASQPAPAPPAQSPLRAMSQVEIQKCDEAFVKLVGGRDSTAAKAELHKYYSLTSLPEEIFSKIWSLTNPTHEGVVGIQQFYLFMYFMTSAVKGENLPAAITEEDVARILGNRGQGSGEAPTMAAPAVAQGGSQSRDPKLQQLVELGFEEGAARSALEAAGNDVDATANHLFGEPSPSGGQAEAPLPPASSPCSLRLVQVSSDVSKVAARVFLQVKVLGPGGSALEQNNMVEIVLGSGGRKETYARIDRTLKYEQSVDELLQSGAKLLFEIKKEKKRSFVGKAWGLLDLNQVSDVLRPGSGGDGVVIVPLSSKPIDVATHKAKRTPVKGSSSQLHIQFIL